ncbi:zinc finger and BTB domain-containing protein 14 isoform X2 [Pieris rapae]|uniref:zinc finger and BTB domain-containing protein 14 isoform X2 n=1 Tax=Pieris rapae TaxID=64459 RepID=UPI001E27B387|nr:zinc finger and BTB domain-containing protein 14 isoform X2 [Pieris rapae]
MTSTDTYQLKWNSHSSHLNGFLASLLCSERFTDVVLCTMDGSQIPTHKFILSSCSVYFSGLFEGQRSVTRMGEILYVVLPSEISTKALKILVEYMYKGETTVSNGVLDMVLKAGEVLKIRGLCRQTDEIGGDSTSAEKTTSPSSKQTEKTKEVETTTSTITMPTPTIRLALDDTEEGLPARIVKINVVEKKYGKKQKMETSEESKEDAGSHSSKKSSQRNPVVEVHVKGEPEWDASSMEEEESSIAEMCLAEMSIKSEPSDGVDVEEERQLYRPLSCELCAEVFSVPAAWVRHVQHHAENDHHHARKRKRRSDSDDTEETTALLRCDLCQKHFPNPAEWVRHVQSSHTETDRSKVLERLLPDPNEVNRCSVLKVKHELTKIEKTRTRQKKVGNIMKEYTEVARKECKGCKALKKRVQTIYECKQCEGSPGFCTKCFCQAHS